MTRTDRRQKPTKRAAFAIQFGKKSRPVFLTKNMTRDSAKPIKRADSDRPQPINGATAVGQMMYHARRAGYLEGALWVIAQGTSGVDPQVAAKRALDAVGDDWMVNGTPPTLPTLGEGSDPKVRSVR